MNTKLKQAQKIFKKEGYDKKAIPEVLQYLKDYKATGKYPYNNDVENYILSKEDVSSDIEKYLKTEIYLAQQDLRAEKDKEKEQEMLKIGFLPLSEVGDFTGPCLFIGTKDIDWMSAKIKKEGKITKTPKGDPFFIPKGNRTRGYYCNDMSISGFYKPLNKINHA